jgi:hypothetical protein
VDKLAEKGFVGRAGLVALWLKANCLFFGQIPNSLESLTKR